MKKSIVFPLAVAAAATVFTVTAHASEDINLNGDFKGAVIGASAVPGWQIGGAGGSSSIVQGGDHDEFGLALTAANEIKYASTDLIQVRGKYLEFEADVRGTGRAAVIINAFDAQRKPLERQAVIEHDPATGSKVKFLCDLKAAENGYINISLAALPGANVIFEDVDAEFENGFAVGTRTLAPVGSSQSRTAVGINPASSPAPAVKELLDDSFFPLKSIGNEVYQISIPVGSDVEFELEESAAAQEQWRIASSDMQRCRVELKHDADGVWPFRTYKSEIEIEAVTAGESRTVFTSPGRSFTVIVKAY